MQTKLRLQTFTLPVLLFTCTTLYVVQLSRTFAQGNLTPPGAPAPTMKTLAQVEPRIDVATLPGDDSNHIIITNAGSYYLSTNLAVTKSCGIIIVAADVTLDLNGFEIARVSGSGGSGIWIYDGSHRATARNGTLRGFDYGVDAGVDTSSQACRFEQLTVTGCSLYGIRMGDVAQAVDCRVLDNAGSGIAAGAGAIIRGCSVQGNQGDYGIYASVGAVVANCTVQNNQVIYGITTGDASTIRDCVVRGNTGNAAIRSGNTCAITDCVARDQYGNYGIFVGASCVIRACVASDNIGTGDPSFGIYGGNGTSIIGCTSNANANTNSSGLASQGIGIYVGGGGAIKDCIVRFNRGDGIQVATASQVEGNTCNSNGFGGDGAGIHSTSTRNRIEANTVTSNDRGIDVDSTASVILRNSAGGNTTNYAIAANNVFGAIVDRTAPASAAVNGNSAASSAATTDPWANFSH